MAFIKKTRGSQTNQRTRRSTLTYLGDNFLWFHFLVAAATTFAAAVVVQLTLLFVFKNE